MAPQSTSAPESWFGHPRGLAVLFNAELWERFSYYGMRALLVLYVVEALGRSETDAYALYAAYGAVVYAFGVVGGWLAQRHLGELRAIVIGGLLMAAGHLVMALPFADGLYLALALLCVGNGLFKPNVSTSVGALYDPDDPRRGQAYYLFYMGINIGATLSPIACGALGEGVGWHVGFGLAGVGMLFGLAVLLRGRRHLRSPSTIADADRSRPVWALALAALVGACAILLWRADWGHRAIELACVAVLALLLTMLARQRGQARARLLALLVLMLFHTGFWAAFEQVGSSFVLLAEEFVDRQVLGVELPATSLVALNGAFIIVLATPMAGLWRRLGARGLEPSTAGKFALGLALLGLGFLAFVVGIERAAELGAPISLGALALCYLLITIGELCLSPIGLAMVTKLAPEGQTNLCMGAWFMTYAAAHLISGAIATATVDPGAGTATATATLARFAEVFSQVGLVALGLAGVLELLSPWVTRLIGERE